MFAVKYPYKEKRFPNVDVAWAARIGGPQLMYVVK